MSTPLSKKQKTGVVALLVAAVFAAFSPALWSDFQTGWDDNFNITENGYFRGLSGEHLAWMFTTFRLGHWQPLSWITLAIDYKLWGLNAFGYHLTNLVLHAANAVLFFYLCRAVLRVAGAHKTADQIAPSLLAALFFAVHPLRVESVVWVTERRDVLSTLFLLSTLLAWFKYTGGGGWRWYVVCLFAYALSLLSKAWGITLFGVLILLDFWPVGRYVTAFKLKSNRGFLVPVLDKIPIFLLAVSAATLALLAQQDSGATHYAENFTGIQKAAQACYGLCFYVFRTVWPSDLLPAYILDKELDPTKSIYLAAFAGVALALIGLATLFIRAKLPAVITSAFVYVALVSPVLGLTQSGVQLVADRYSYLSTMPFAILLAAGLGRIAAPELRKAAGLVVAAALVLYAYNTFDYSQKWKNSVVLWEYTLTVQPNHSLALNQLGTQHKRSGRDAKALDYYERAVQANPKSHLAYENRGVMKMRFGDKEGALADFDRALALNEYCAIPIVNRGSFKMEDKDYAGARADFEIALERNGEQPAVLYNLASACRRLGDFASAREAIETCIKKASKDSPLYGEAIKLRSQLPR